jgi:hypothetical protein
MRTEALVAKSLVHAPCQTRMPPAILYSHGGNMAFDSYQIAHVPSHEAASLFETHYLHVCLMSHVKPFGGASFRKRPSTCTPRVDVHQQACPPTPPATSSQHHRLHDKAWSTAIWHVPARHQNIPGDYFDTLGRGQGSGGRGG